MRIKTSYTKQGFRITYENLLLVEGFVEDKLLKELIIYRPAFYYSSPNVLKYINYALIKYDHNFRFSILSDTVYILFDKNLRFKNIFNDPICNIILYNDKAYLWKGEEDVVVTENEIKGKLIEYNNPLFNIFVSLFYFFDYDDLPYEIAHQKLYIDDISILFWCKECNTDFTYLIVFEGGFGKYAKAIMKDIILEFSTALIRLYPMTIGINYLREHFEEIYNKLKEKDSYEVCTNKLKFTYYIDKDMESFTLIKNELQHICECLIKLKFVKNINQYLEKCKRIMSRIHMLQLCKL